MKLKTCGTFVGASLFITPSLFAQVYGTGSLNIDAPNFDNGGNQAGPYLVSDLTVSTGDTPASSFQTFCIGSQVDYTSPGSYNYLISPTVQPGSVANNGTGLTYVTLGTAYLYSQFLAGTLGFGGNTTTVDNNVSDETANAGLQMAIWNLQGQTWSGVVSFGSLNLSDVEAEALMFEGRAASALGAGNVENNANGQYGIYALDMYTGSSAIQSDYAQPELVQIPVAPVPESNTVYAAACLLVPLGLSTWRTLRKQREV
jgi:hypothetical protein